MHIRPATLADMELLIEIDGTIESMDYLHLERSGEGLGLAWKLNQRPHRSKLIESNAMDDERRFTLKQILTGADEGLALAAEHDEVPVALALAVPEPSHGTLKLVDLRVDYDMRKQGIATVLGYQVVNHAKDLGLRAVVAETRTNNLPANKLMQKLAFEIAGIDTHRHSNHDIVKEAATIFWYAALD
jgi:RimJ/RimL family protein N-acetyltransferase